MKRKSGSSTIITVHERLHNTRPVKRGDRGRFKRSSVTYVRLRITAEKRNCRTEARSVIKLRESNDCKKRLKVMEINQCGMNESYLCNGFSNTPIMLAQCLLKSLSVWYSRSQAGCCSNSCIRYKTRCVLLLHERFRQQ